MAKRNQPLLFDVGHPDLCTKRHGGSPESQDAFRKVEPDLTRLQAEALTYIREQTALGKGCTAKEYAVHVGKPLHAVSARFSELARDGRIRKGQQPDGTIRRRDGSAVMEAVQP